MALLRFARRIDVAVWWRGAGGPAYYLDTVVMTSQPMPEDRKERRDHLLRDLARKAEGRHDLKLGLSEVAPSLDIAHFHGGTKFVDKEKPTYEGGSDLAYDYCTLLDEGLIEPTYLKYEQNDYGEYIPSIPAVRVTPAGMALVAELEKSWLRKGIEKEPMTFTGVVVAVIIAAISAVGGWVVGRQTAPDVECPPQVQTLVSPPITE